MANGPVPARRIVRRLAELADLVVCADGGANIARKHGIRPDIILGDLDSVLASTKTFYRRVPLLAAEDQDSTDLEKAISFCVARKISSVDILGATGERIDHTAGSLGCFKRFGDTIQLRFIDSFGELFRVGRHMRMNMRKGEKLSLIPLGRCVGVTTRNLKYPLTNEFLELGVREGISNEATAPHVSISVRQGVLLIYRMRAKASWRPF